MMIVGSSSNSIRDPLHAAVSLAPEEDGDSDEY
jgi:hypothetical protein